jgi:hypothetical protein
MYRPDVIQRMSDVVVLRRKNTYEAGWLDIIFEAGKADRLMPVDRPRE